MNKIVAKFQLKRILQNPPLVLFKSSQSPKHRNVGETVTAKRSTMRKNPIHWLGLHALCRGHGVPSLAWNWDPACHMACPAPPKEKHNKKWKLISYILGGISWVGSWVISWVGSWVGSRTKQTTPQKINNKAAY